VIYLSGKWVDEFRADRNIGMLCQPNYPVPPQDGIPWAADTGIFGTMPFSLERYLERLDVWQTERGRCLFATAPDVVADWEKTLETSMPVMPLIREKGYRGALVLQDGATSDTVPWNDIDAVFTGGSTEWKLSEEAYRLVQEAKDRGLWAHMGRVNSLRRLRAAHMGGYDSADGTFVVFGPDKNAPHVMRWMDSLNKEPTMELFSYDRY
jgi:hypothetical protein